MKVVHVTEVAIGGVMTVMDGLAAGQAGLSGVDEVVRLCPGDGTERPHARVRDVTYRRSGRDLRSQFLLCFHLVRLLLREHVDVLHLHSTFAGAWGRLLAGTVLRSRCRVIVYTPHGFAFLAPSPWQAVHGWIERHLALLCDAVICVSQQEMDAALGHGLPRCKLHLIRNGVPVQDECKKSSNSRPRLLFVGRFDRQKGFDILQEALALVRKDHELTARAVGAPYRDGGRAIDSRSGLDCLGWLRSSALHAQYRWADCVVVPSRWEGFALVPLEAMSFGCAVVASDCCSLPEAVAEGSTGRLFPSGDAAALARVLAEESADHLRALGREGARRQRDDFAAPAVVHATQALYLALMHRSQHGNNPARQGWQR